MIENTQNSDLSERSILLNCNKDTSQHQTCNNMESTAGNINFRTKVLQQYYSATDTSVD